MDKVTYPPAEGYPPPAANYPPPQYPPPQYAPPTQQMTVFPVVTQTTVISVGRESARLVCPTCLATINTTVTSSPSSTAYIAAGILCLFGCWLCCCIPCCMDSMQEYRHTCPNCRAEIGTYRA